MEYFKLRDGNKLPVIALGPGAVVRKEVLPYAHLSSNPIVKIGQKVVNKLIYEKESLVFINNVARGINLGFELIDNSAAYGSSQLVHLFFYYWFIKIKTFVFINFCLVFGLLFLLKF